jgi:glycosyltransferase involved in cell wall biosynthesis
VLAGKASTWDEVEYYEQVLTPLFDGHNVRFVGEADAALKRELYGGANACLAPIQWEEPFGLVVVEALACGTPVISFNRGAAPELITDGVTGYLVDDVAGMTQALSKLDAVDPAACRADMMLRFSASALADGYLAIYGRMLAEAAGAYDGEEDHGEGDTALSA